LMSIVYLIFTATSEISEYCGNQLWSKSSAIFLTLVKPEAIEALSAVL
jgi:hypothetical protein